MSPERWKQVSQLFHAALARDAAERAMFLAGECAGDLELRQIVESLYDRVVKETGRPDGRGVAQGRVTAHELGHLLTGQSGHSVDGIMRASLDLHAPSSPPLLAEQAQAIRDRLLARRLARVIE